MPTFFLDLTWIPSLVLVLQVGLYLASVRVMSWFTACFLSQSVYFVNQYNTPHRDIIGDKSKKEKPPVFYVVGK